MLLQGADLSSSRLDVLRETFARQESTAEIAPIRFHVGKFHSQPDNYLIVSICDQGKIDGALQYILISPDDFEDLRTILTKDQNLFTHELDHDSGTPYWRIDFGTLPGLETSELLSPFAFLRDLESYQKGRGSKLIKELQATASIEGIIVEASNPSIGFYDRMGFIETGLYSQNNPVMVWMA
jgi:hypothetical protein